jgi:TolB protein
MKRHTAALCAPADTIPWSQVGVGWVLATWSPLTGHRPGPRPADEPDTDTVSTTLYLVDPLGGRYPITTFPPSKKSAPELIDWSGDKGRALFSSVGSDDYTEVDLHTGNQRTITFPASPGYPRYTLPEGKALLMTSGGYNQPKSLVRLDLNGQEQLTYPVPQDFGGVLSTPDGGQPTALTAPNDRQTGPDYGDVAAWRGTCPRAPSSKTSARAASSTSRSSTSTARPPR